MRYRNLSEFMEQNGYVIRGDWYPRVTSIIDIKSKPQLYKYYAESKNYGDALSSSRRSAHAGTRVHNAIEALLMGREPEQDDEIYPSVQAFEDFRKAYSIVADHKLIEQRIYHPKERYAGTADVFAEINGVFGILDVKTSSGIWRDYNLQTAAYLAACQEDDCLVENRLPRKPETRWILRLDQGRVCRVCGARMRSKGGRDKVTGGFDLCEHNWGPVRGEWELKDLNDSSSFEADYKAFLGAKILWEWENEYWLKQIN